MMPGALPVSADAAAHNRRTHAVRGRRGCAGVFEAASKSTAVLAATVLLLTTLAGCGTGGSSSSTTTTSSAYLKRSAARARAAERLAPKGASSTLRGIYVRYPPPRPDPRVKSSAAAIRAAEKACAGKTPTEVKDIYYPVALRKGRLTATGKVGSLVARIATLEKRYWLTSGASAGLLAADVYRHTLPLAIAPYGYQGCLFALARQLERRLAPR